MSIQLTPNAHNSYKIGLNEVVGLEEAMELALKPILDHLNEISRTWSGDGWFKFDTAEYKSRDGFIAHSHNLGGVMIESIIPKCGEYDFGFLEFGEYETDGLEDLTESEIDSRRESEESEGYLDAKLRIWLKLESLDDESLNFYLVMSGGNGDAPYFREKHQPTLFEASFACSSVFDLAITARPHVEALMAVIK